MLVSQREDHKRNFHRTRDLANTLAGAADAVWPLPSFGPSLLRFYAAESGLKYLLNRKMMVPFSYQVDEEGAQPDNEAGFPQRVEKYSHNLPRMLSRLKVSAAMVSVPAGPFRTIGGYGNGQDFELAAAHEAWRYGLAVNDEHQTALEKFLGEVIAYIEEEIL
ncbi:hypothetical protein [Burkholderia ubonensis]|uniref:hypothetical protein n=1 Tax=Burkholderia ubonensis TaxID=101571 RepID=UPI000ABFDAEE|nr:hypothetical protein [Burkholderia ubonensis]